MERYFIDDFLEHAVKLTIGCIAEKNNNGINELPKKLKENWYAVTGVDETFFYRLWRPVYWHLCLSDLNIVDTDSAQRVFTYTRKSIIETNGGNVRKIDSDVMNAYEERAMQENTAKEKILANEIKQKYFELYRALIGKQFGAPGTQ